MISYMGIDTGLLAGDVQKELDKLPAVYGTTRPGCTQRRRLNQILLQAADKADRFRMNTPELNIYAALLKERGTPSTDIFRRDRDQQGEFPVSARKGQEQSADHIKESGGNI